MAEKYVGRCFCGAVEIEGAALRCVQRTKQRQEKSRRAVRSFKTMLPRMGSVARVFWFAALPLIIGLTVGVSGSVAFEFRPELFDGAIGESLHSRNTVQQFYQERMGKRAWTGPHRPALDQLQKAIGASPAHGLSPRDYHAGAIAAAITAKNDVAIELLATDAYLTLGAHLLRGKVDPTSIEPNWTISKRSGDLVQNLSNALKSGRIQESLEALSPNVPSYRILRSALKKFSKSSARGERPSIPIGPALKSGAQGPRVRLLRQKLADEGFLSPNSDLDVDRFDNETESAVQSFQRETGLAADGVVGPQTLRELNRSAAERVSMIRANLERWRWLAEDLGPRHIRVNIADFRLEAWDAGHPVRSHDVIVGRTYRKTPVFSDMMSYVVFNPWWDVPHNIARLDKLRDFKSDPTSIGRLGYEVFDKTNKRIDATGIDWGAYSAQHFPFRLRQRPGPENALGEIKLMFPNRHSVYLHGTPAQELFKNSKRDFSSGCIRVHRVLDLAEWVLRDTPGWDRERMEATVKSGRETRLNLSKKLPIHILYMTVVAKPDGSVRFLQDIYDRDRRLFLALDG